MQPMSTIWPWSSRACATSDIKMRSNARVFCQFLIILIFICASMGQASAKTIQAASNIQTAIDSAQAGDIIVVSAEEANSFVVDRPMTIEGNGKTTLSAAMQKPAIKVLSDGVTISGFRIKGMGKDTTAKFNYYMQNPTAAANVHLNDPNSAIVVKGDDVSIKNCSIFGAQTAVYAENIRGLLLLNTSMDSCDTGASILKSKDILVSGCTMTNCKKYGLYVESSSGVSLNNNSIVNNTNGGILLKASEDCTAFDNALTKNTFGLALWNASFNQVRRNRVDHNYYGILITAWSNYNNITDNQAKDNKNSDIATGFGIGISLQENSSYNMLLRNTATGNFNGLEVSKGCQFNAVYDNNASENKHGIRLNENRNNLIIGNNFVRNEINAYENASQNTWNNTSIGNYYSDYSGKDRDGDGIGDDAYSLPGPDSHSFDYRPLIRQYRTVQINYTALSIEVKKFAVYAPAIEDQPTTKIQNGVIVISKKASKSPPKWSETDDFDASAAPFLKKTEL